MFSVQDSSPIPSTTISGRKKNQRAQALMWSRDGPVLGPHCCSWPWRKLWERISDSKELCLPFGVELGEAASFMGPLLAAQWGAVEQRWWRGVCIEEPDTPSHGPPHPGGLGELQSVFPRDQVMGKGY